MASWRGHGKGRLPGQPSPEFSGGAGRGGGRMGGQPRVPGEGGAGAGGGRAGAQPRVPGEGGAGRGGGRMGSQPQVHGEGGPGAGGGRAGGQPTIAPRVEYGGRSTRMGGGGEAARADDMRAGSSYRASSGEMHPRVADPEGNFIFALEIEGIEVAQFKECSGLKSVTEVFELIEGGQNHRVHKLPGQSRWDNIRLRFGTTKDLTLVAWRNEILQDEFANRRNGSVVMKTLSMEEVRRFEFVQAWPVSWEGPAFVADAAELAIETLELAHHGIHIS